MKTDWLQFKRKLRRCATRMSIATSIVLTSGPSMSVMGQVTRAGLTTNQIEVFKTPYAVVERGPHHKLWQRATLRTNSISGVARWTTNSYVELSTGMARLVGDQWVDSSPQIEITPTGARANNSQHSVAFLGDITSPGAVEVTTPDGSRLKSNILGLSYFDTSTGNAIFFADLRSSIGQLLPSANEALYPDAFSGCDADVLYVNSIAGIEQLIVLRSQLPSPAIWKLNPETTMLQVITEFLNPPTPEISISADGSFDQTLGFGLMQMGKGSAFALGEETNRIPVTKQWQILNARTCLVEQVPLQAVLPWLKDLPLPPEGTAGIPSPSYRPDRLARLQLPPPRQATINKQSLKLAKSLPSTKGFVMDYTLLNSQTNVTLQSDTTYYVTGTVVLSGTNNVVEGLTVVKFTNSPSATLSASSIKWKTGPYLPAVFTGKDDDQVGEQLSHSTGNPTTNFYAGIALDLTAATNAPTVPNVRFCYLSNAVAGANITLQDCQIINCLNGLAANSSQPTLLNVLIYKPNKVFANTSGATLTCENVTAHYCTNFLGNTSGTINLTNCLFVCVTNWQCTTTRTNCDAFLSSDTGVFTTAGGGAHYLAAGSVYRNMGTTNISSNLLTDLTKGTTYAPLIYSNTVISTTATFNPLAQRDVDTPDVGYHYYPLDFLFCSVKTTNSSTVNIAQGTAIGMFANYSDGYGLDVDGASQLVSQGSANSRNWIVTFNTVQEFPMADWWTEDFELIQDALFQNSPNALIDLRATSMSSLGTSSYLLYVNKSALNCRDSEFRASNFGYILALASVHLTNCLFERLETDFAPDVNNGEPPGYTCSAFCNNLFYRGYFELYQPNYPQNIPVVRDNLFDTTFIYHSFNDDRGYNGCNNAYVVGVVTNENRSLHPCNNDITFNAPLTYETGPLGFYYQPASSPLFNAGSIAADVGGLYHYTVFTSQSKETNSVVDIGYHYVALGANGNSFDGDGDGVPDYLEDANGNGNGADDPTSWQVFNSPNGLTGTATLQVFTPLK